MRRTHAMPFGAHTQDSGTRFRLWAPSARQVALCVDEPVQERLPMEAQDDGWYELVAPGTGAGSRYRFEIDGELRVPDPASRFQPQGVHAASEVIDPGAFAWSDDGWRGRAWEEAVFYELHLGAFSAQGGYAGALGRLDHLAELGVTAIELMPLSDCPGARNWGYDGVLPFAPAARYGRPDALKAFVEAAHTRGLMVFLDVVYNHFGPDGNYLARYAAPFFDAGRRTPWGAGIDFDGAESRSVRDFFIHNALYWLEEYHLDGLRLDAVHAIEDRSEPHLLEELGQAVRSRFADERQVHLVLENERNEARWLARDPEGRPRLYSAQWNDDIHHALHVALTGERDGYYADYAEAPLQQLGRCLAEGFAFQGEPSPLRDGAPRGEPCRHLPPGAFVSFLQNHDQVGNRAFGERIERLAEPAAIRAALAILLLAPAPPLLFMGQEWGCDQPFPFFCDFEGELATQVRRGRRKEFARFEAFREPEARARIPDPGAPETFESAVLRWSDLDPVRLRFTRELLDLRKRVIVPRVRSLRGGAARYQLLGSAGLRVAWALPEGEQLVLLSQLGSKPSRAALERPEGTALFATPEGCERALQGGELPAWSTAWYLTAAKRQRGDTR